jgi:hypothetical protein
MPTPARLIATMLALGLCAAAAAQPAAAKTVTYKASFESTFTTKWDMPAFLTGGSCFRKNYSRGSGEETWTMKTRKAQRVTITTPIRGGYLFGAPIDLHGVHKRSGGSEVFWHPGDCGGVSGRNPDPESDCGTRLPEYELNFDAGDGKVEPNPLTAGHMRREKLHFATCEIRLADGLQSGVWPKVAKKLPLASIKAGRRKIEISGAEKWGQTFNEGRGGEYRTDSSISWKLTLTR